MVTFLITSFLLLAGITYVIYLWQRPSSNRETDFLLPPPPGADGLFAEKVLKEAQALELQSGEATAYQQRQSFLERAAAGEREALRDASATNDDALYDEVLDAL